MVAGFDVPSGTILPVDTVRIELTAAPHPFEVNHRDEIDRNWARARNANPTLFDGEVVLLSVLRLCGTTLTGTAHVVRFATFLCSRDRRPAPRVAHVFAHAMPVAADGSLLAIRMAAHTVNAGRVYFAAGSFEPQDFSAGFVDLPHNMRREVLEETGLDLDDARAESRYVLHSSARGTVLAKRYHFDASAEDLAAAVTRFVAAQSVSEIVGPVIIRGSHDLAAGLMDHMHPLIAWHFAKGELH